MAPPVYTTKDTRPTRQRDGMPGDPIVIDFRSLEELGRPAQYSLTFDANGVRVIPPIRPPPSEAHTECHDCASHFFSTADQDDPKNRYRLHFEDTKEAQMATTKLLQEIAEDLSEKAGLLLTVYDVFPSWPPTPLQGSEKDLPFMQDLWDVSNCTWGQWLNINSFAKGRMKLLSLLQMRTAYGPEAWAVFDLCETRLVFESLHIWRMDYCAAGIVMHGEKFGTVEQFDAELAHRGTIAGFRRATLALSAQKVIASMLRKVVGALVVDKQASGCTKWTALVSKGFRSSLGEPWSTYYNQAFMPPSSFDPVSLLEKSRSHLNLIKDEIQLMQTSPEYMHQYVLELKAGFYFEDGATQRKI